MTNFISNFAKIIDPGDISNLPQPVPGGGADNPIAKALQFVFAIAGAISVLVITIAAFQYVISQGEPQSTAKAKNTILYAIIGLIVCAAAFTIVTFVLGEL